MRDVVNISLTASLNEIVEREMRKGMFASKSEFFRYLIRQWQEKELADELALDRKLFEAGKGKELKSLKSLRK